VEKVHEECEFEHVVEWNPLKNEAGEMINNVEDSEDNPVSEPLFLLRLIVRIETDEGFECWVGNSNKASNVASADSENNEY
jgi:hypothetical protein